MAIQEKLNEILNEVNEIASDVVGALIIDSDQFLIMASTLSESSKELNDDSVVATSASLLGAAEQMAKLLLDNEPLEQLYIKTQGKYVIFNAIGSHALLLVITTTKAKLGLIFFGLKQIQQKLLGILGT